VTVEVDKVTLIPAHRQRHRGLCRRSDRQVDRGQLRRPGFTEVSRPDYRPSAADSQAFMQQLSAALQKRGM